MKQPVKSPSAIDRLGSKAIGALFAWLVLSLANAPAEAAGSNAVDDDPWGLCTRHTAAAERKSGLPPHLLGAIARVESGRWSGRDKAILAWPWTVMAEGKGRFLPSRAAAVAAVEALRARGVRNIDVGCMQVNLRYHPEAFENLDAAFDPGRNVAYAAGYLSQLKAETGSWTTAIGRYHSKTPRLSGAYRLKVFRAWRDERRRDTAARLAKRAAAPGQLAVRPLWGRPPASATGAASPDPASRAPGAVSAATAVQQR